MKTMNLSPKNLLPLAVLLIGAYALTRRTAQAAPVASGSGVIRPSIVGTTVSQQAQDAWRNAQILNIGGAVADWLSGLKPSIVDSSARTAVRFNDPYYSTAALAGTPPGASDNPTAAAWAYGAGLGMDTLNAQESDYLYSPAYWS